MLKPVQFLKPRNVAGPFYQAGDVAGFMPELVAQLVADGTACELEVGGIPVLPRPPAETAPAEPEKVGTFSGFPYATAEERQAALKNGKPRR